jgi:SPP1 gp7 family putative phage head morphogenesis protein
MGLRLRTNPDIDRALRRRRAWQRRRGKKFSLTPPPLLHPRQIERQYLKELNLYFDEFFASVNENLISRLDSLLATARMELEPQRFDDFPDELETILGGILVEFGRRLTDDEIESLAKRIGGQTSRWNLAQNDKVFRQVLSVDVFRHEPYLEGILESFSRENAQLITSLPQRHINEVRSVVMRGVRQGLPAQAVRELIEQKTGKTEANLNLIARDQVSKLNGQLTKVRQTSLGVKKYIWRTSLDERVRPTHRIKEGRTYSWNDPPSDTGHPGEDYQCFVGSTKVKVLGHLKRMYRRKYSGDGFAVSFEGDASKMITTPNHPIFTSRGFVATKDIIQDSDKLFVRSTFFKKPIITHNNVNNGPTISEMFDNFSSIENPAKRVHGRRQDFHGDGIVNADIDVKLLPSKLGSAAKTTIFKKIFDSFFKFSFSSLSILISFRNAAFMRVCSFTSSACDVGIFNLRPALVGGHFRPFENFSFGSFTETN